MVLTLETRSTDGRRLHRLLANSQISSPGAHVWRAVERRLSLDGGRFFFLVARRIFEIVFDVNHAYAIQLFELSLWLYGHYIVIIIIWYTRYAPRTPYRHHRGDATTCGFDFISKNGSNGRIAYHDNNFPLPVQL